MTSAHRKVLTLRLNSMPIMEGKKAMARLRSKEMMFLPQLCCHHFQKKAVAMGIANAAQNRICPK